MADTNGRLTHAERRERRRRAAEAVAAGEDMAKVAAREGVYVDTVRKACVEFGVDPTTRREARRKRSRENSLRIAEAVQNGMAVEEAAARFGVSRSWAQACCHENGVSPRSVVRTGACLQVLADLLNTDNPVLQVAREHGVTKQYVYQVLQQARAAGIKVRGK